MDQQTEPTPRSRKSRASVPPAAAIPPAPFAPRAPDRLIPADPRKLRESPFQKLHRKDVGDITEITNSIRQHGVIEPVIVREVDAELEIVAGHRRTAAAVAAGVVELWVILRDLTDDDVLECQVIENNQREDCHPLYQARGYQAMIERGHTTAFIAERIGRDVGYVAKRLKLLDLCPAGRKALDEERLTLVVALMLARVPDAKLQEEALEKLTGDKWEPPMKADEARKFLQEEFLLRLADAPFDTTDAELVPKAGPCTTCPKRTGRQAELFDDIKSPDLCTDPKCFHVKADAVWKIRKKEAAAGGTEVIEGKEAEQIGYGRKYRRLDEDDHSGNKTRKVRDVIAKAKPPVLLARDDETGKVFEVVRGADVDKITKGNKREKITKDPYAEKAKREAANQKLRRRAITLTLAAAVKAAGKLAPMDVLDLVVRGFCAVSWNEVQVALLEARGIKPKAGGGPAETQLLKLAKDMSDNGEIMGLGLELAMRAGSPWHSHTRGLAELWTDGLALAGLDFAAFEKQVNDAEKERKGGEAKGKKAAPSNERAVTTISAKKKTKATPKPRAAPKKKAAKKAAKKGKRK